MSNATMIKIVMDRCSVLDLFMCNVYPPDHSIGKKLNGWVTRNFSVAPVVLIDKELGQIEYF